MTEQNGYHELRINGSNGNDNDEGDETVMGGYDEGEDLDEGGHMDEDDGDD